MRYNVSSNIKQLQPHLQTRPQSPPWRRSKEHEQQDDKAARVAAAANVVLDATDKFEQSWMPIGMTRKGSQQQTLQAQHAHHYITNDANEMGGSAAIQTAADGPRAPTFEPSPFGWITTLGILHPSSSL